jgi:hypothetical protein
MGRRTNFDVPRDTPEVFYNKSYREILDWIVNKHVGPGKLELWDAERLHKKWKRLSAEVRHAPMR